MGIHSNILAWKIPCTEEPGRLSPWDTKSWTQLRELNNNNNNKIPAILVVWMLKVKVLVSQFCLIICNPSSLPGSCVHVILQARILEWVATPFSRVSSWPRDQTRVSHIAGEFFTIWATRKTCLNAEPLSNPKEDNDRQTQSYKKRHP